MSTATTTKPPATIFYSWQSDLPNSTNRSFIQKCLEKAIKELGREEQLQSSPRIDRDTSDVPGTPHIPQTIFDKIDASDLFVGDVTLVAKYKRSDDEDKTTPIPNVLIELGYAVKSLSWDQIICVANTYFGELRDLPFDLEKRRIVGYRLEEGADKANAQEALVGSLKDKISKSLVVAVPRSAPAVEVFFANPETEEDLGQSMKIFPKVTEGLDRDLMPDHEESPPGIFIGGNWISTPSVRSVFEERPNPEFYRECFDYYMLVTTSKPICVGIRNNGKVLLTGVKIQISIAGQTTLRLKEFDADCEPRKRIRRGNNFGYRRSGERPGDVTINSKRMEITFGKVQCGETLISDSFWLGATDSCQIILDGRIFSDQYAPGKCELLLESIVTNRSQLTNEALMERFEELERSQQADIDDDDSDYE